MITHLRSIHLVEQQTSPEVLTAVLASLDEKVHKDSMELIQKTQNKCNEAQLELQNLLKEEELVSDYLAKNISKGWLGTYVALAWAKITIAL